MPLKPIVGGRGGVNNANIMILAREVTLYDIFEYELQIYLLILEKQNLETSGSWRYFYSKSKMSTDDGFDLRDAEKLVSRIK